MGHNDAVDLMQCSSLFKADFLSSQKPLAASKQVLASSQNNFLSSHKYDNFNEHRPSWSFKQTQLNQAIMINLRLTEHANIFLNTYPVVSPQSSFSAASPSLYKKPAMFHHCNHPIVRPF